MLFSQVHPMKYRTGPRPVKDSLTEHRLPCPYGKPASPPPRTAAKEAR